MEPTGEKRIRRKTEPEGISSEKPQDADSACGFFASKHYVSFRPMTLADIDAVMAIERAAFPYPWSTRFFLQELQVECARSIIAEVDGKVAGYILFWLLPDEVDIHNLAVDTAFRRCGIGRALLQSAVRQAKGRGSVRVTLEVRKSNTGAQRLYESVGFVKTGIRKGYYSDNGEDALAMALELRRRESKPPAKL
jgi:ribosomal-protein-alanine N-acetyltransferase